jgi:hypothetical protein
MRIGGEGRRRGGPGGRSRKYSESLKEWWFRIGKSGGRWDQGGGLSRRPAGEGKEGRADRARWQSEGRRGKVAARVEKRSHSAA